MKKEYYAELWRKTEWMYREPRVVRFAERLGEGASYRRGYVEGAMVYGLGGIVGLRAGIEEWVGGARLWCFGLVLGVGAISFGK